MDGCDIQGLANVQLMTFRWRSWNSSFVTSFWYVTWWRNARCEWLSAAWVEKASSVAALQMFSQRSIQSPQFNSEQQGPQSPVYSHIKCEIRSQSDFCPLAVAYKVLRLLNFIMSQWIWPLTLSSVHFMQWDINAIFCHNSCMNYELWPCVVLTEILSLSPFNSNQFILETKWVFVPDIINSL